MKIITKEWLEENNVCSSGMRWFLSQAETDASKVMIKLEREDRFNDAFWILKNVSSTEQLCKVAIFCAKLVLPFYEAYERSNDEPRKAIEAAELALANPTEENKRAVANQASYAALAAADAALTAAGVAHAAAYFAARVAHAADEAAIAASYAAYAAAYAAYTATYFAAHAAAHAAAYAARKEMQLKIINYAIEICGL